jgi:hypothetical protein
VSRTGPAADARSVSAPPFEPNAAIARIESGLLPPILWKGEPRAHMALADRMSDHKVNPKNAKAAEQLMKLKR